MSDDIIKPEWKQVWKWAARYNPESREGCLAEFAQYLLAKLHESEFKREHQLSYQGGCLGCRFLNNNELDPRHNYDEAKWVEVAKKELE